jgi:CBF/Mak21 family
MVGTSLSMNPQQQQQPQQQYAQVAAQIKQLLQETKITRRDDRADAARLDELRRVFRNVAQQDIGDLDNNTLTGNENEKDSESSSARAKWRTFLKKSFAKMIQQLMHRIVVGGKRTAIRTLWAVIANFPITTIATTTQRNNTTAAASSSSSRTAGVDIINVDLLTQWIRAISTCPALVWKDQSVQHMIQAEFVGPFRDVQYYAMIAIATVAHQLYNNNNEKNEEHDRKKKTQHAQEQQAERLVQLLMMIPIVTSQKELLDAESSKFLFCPPPAPKAASVTTNSDNDSDDESNDDEDSDDDDDNEDSRSSEDEGEEQKNDKKKSSSATRHDLASLLSFQRKTDHVRAWNKAWLAVLRLPCLPRQTLQVVLQFLPRHVLNVVSHPLQFADFFMQAYSMNIITTNSSSAATTTTSHEEEEEDRSRNDNDRKKGEEKNKSQQQHTTSSTTTSSSNSIIPILALDGLFILMTKHGLEYPNYYQQLYRLVTIPLFYYKKSTSHQFFVLLEKSLVYNELLPAHIVAAFCKRLARCALQAPPASILVALALISNVLRKHPETACLIQASSSAVSKNDTQNSKNNIIDDAFDATTDNPVHARALQSSLWELQALTHHYHAAVATLADSIGRVEECKVAPHALQEHFLSLNYKSLFETDRKRAAIVVINSSTNSAAPASSDDKDNKKSKKRKRNVIGNSTTALTFARPENGLFGNPGDVLTGLLDIA